MFIENKDIKWNSQEFTLIPMINELFEKRVYKEYIENIKKLDEEIRNLKKDRQNNKIEIKNKEIALKSLQDHNYLNIEIIRQYIGNLIIEIHIASYYDMCMNCQATFNYDLKRKRQLQKSIFSMMIGGIDKKKLTKV